MTDYPPWLMDRPSDVPPVWWDATRACYRAARSELGREPSRDEVLDLLRQMTDDAFERAIAHEPRITRITSRPQAVDVSPHQVEFTLARCPRCRVEFSWTPEVRACPACGFAPVPW